jgi:hypothetical protein
MELAPIAEAQPSFAALGCKRYKLFWNYQSKSVSNVSRFFGGFPFS